MHLNICTSNSQVIAQGELTCMKVHVIAYVPTMPTNLRDTLFQSEAHSSF